jgi:hypothetical protein
LFHERFFLTGLLLFRDFMRRNNNSLPANTIDHAIDAVSGTGVVVSA